MNRFINTILLILFKIFMERESFLTARKMHFNHLFSQLAEADFATITSSPENCLAFLANMKWQDGYQCKKCGNANYCKGSTPHSRRCTRCKYSESATANTPFHGCHIPLPVAFGIAREICCKPKVSTWELSRQTDIRQMTCWKLKKKITNSRLKGL